MLFDYLFVQKSFSSNIKSSYNNHLQVNIPDYWKIVDINDVCKVTDCLHSKKPEYNYCSDDYYLLGLENITSNGYIDTTTKYYISESDYKVWTSRVEIQENDFVVTNAGRAGDIGKIPQGIKCAIGRNITAIRPQNISPYYLRQFFKSIYFKNQVARNLDSGSFFMSFNVKSIKKLQIPIPEKTELMYAVKKFEPIIIRIENNVIENQHLASFRNWLLPMLMNGQATISD